MKKKIFITGGAGYCGSRLVPILLSKGHEVTVYDSMWFTDEFLPKNEKKLKIIAGDIRDTNLIREHSKNHNIFLHLGCVSNDASFELDEKLSKSVNYDSFEPMVLAAKENGIERFIYASTSSVYGISDQKNVTEDHPKKPITLYSKYKNLCEPLLNKYADENFTCVSYRPATVCGYGPRLRLDVSVNILTNHAYFNNKIIVFGGDQLRPNLHILDYCAAVELLMEASKNKVQKEVYNIGYENMSIMNIAMLVKKVIEKRYPDKKVDIERTESDDNRSYHINSDKIKNELNFIPKHTIEDAINEICDAFEVGKVKNTFEDDIYFNVKRLKNLNIQ